MARDIIPSGITHVSPERRFYSPMVFKRCDTTSTTWSNSPPVVALRHTHKLPSWHVPLQEVRLLTTRHATAAAYLEYVRFVHEDPIAAIQSEPNHAFQKIFDQKLARLAKEGATFDLKGQTPHARIVSDLWENLRRGLSDVFDASLELAIGELDNMSVNAFCSRSEEGHFAIVINSGLMTLFNKLSKISIAVTEPESIEYCSRELHAENAQAMLIGFQKEVCKHYRETRKPLGPQLLLKGDADDRHSMQLHIWEMFVLCHEVGHVLCGHLTGKELMISQVITETPITPADPDARRMEVEADCIGLLLLKEYVAKEMPDAFPLGDDRLLLGHLITLFNHLSELGTTESASHPPALTRLCNMVEFVYGEALAQTLQDSYSDNSLIRQIFGSPLIPGLTYKECFSHA